MTGCSDCGRGFYEECELDNCPCEYHSPPPPKEEKKDGRKDTIPKDEEESKVLFDRSKQHKDAFSTGRKRAAIHYPFLCRDCRHTKQQHEESGKCSKDNCDCALFRGLQCEWQGLKNVGGGKHPITGCVEGVQTDRHHGPIKDTMRNELGNVHRICSVCHHRWHEINDYYYTEKEYITLLHSPEPATDQELLDNEIAWRTGKLTEKYIKRLEGKFEKYD